MIAPQEREKVPFWSTRPRPLRNGREGCKRVSRETKSLSVWSKRKGPLIYALLEYPFFVLYPINPATAARYRMAFKTSRAKDDPSDAQVCLELMLHHREKLNPWLSNDAQTRELSCLLQHRRAAVDFAHAFYQYAARCTQELLSPGPGIGRSGSLCPAGLPLPAQMAFAPAAAQSAQRKCAQILLCAQLLAHGCD